MYSNQSTSALQTLLDFIRSPFRTIKYFYRDLSEIDDRLRDDSLAVRALTMVVMPFRLLGGFLSLMVQNWPTSRSGFAAIAAIPAFFTLLGLLGAWILVDYVRNDSWRIGANQGYYQLNIEKHSDTPESALAYARKLVEIDPSDETLKYQLGLAEMRAGNSFAANDVMTNIAPDNPPEDNVGFLDGHIWRARYLVQNKNLEEFAEAIELAEQHLKIVIAAEKDNLTGKYQLAQLYLNYANRLEEQSPKRLEYLIKADETFREIIEGESETQINRSIRITTLRPSVLVRKQLEAIDPEKYSAKDEIIRVRKSVEGFLKSANRYKLQDIRLWQILMNSASEIRQFDFAVDIADQGAKIIEDPKTQTKLNRAKAGILQKAALSINNFDEFESYRDRFIYLCKARRTAPRDPTVHLLLLQYIGNENPKPTTQFARQLGLAKPGDPVPIKPEWLYRVCLTPEYTAVSTSLIGMHEFHLGNNKTAVKNWSVAQQFDVGTRELIAKLLETVLIKNPDKLDHLDSMLAEAVEAYPEEPRVRMARGIYFIKEEMYQAAIDDFRVALDVRPNELLLHQKIKTCYEYLGQRQAAANEQQIIDAKIQRLPEEARPQFRELLRKMESRESANL